MGKSKATLKNISESLQISISTVSRALKDHPDIAEQTKKKVRELAEMMDYEPNAFAIYLRTNHSKLLGLIVPEISDYFYHSFIAAVEEEARKKGYSLMILQSADNPDTELSNIRLCKLNRVAGIMVALSGSGRTDFSIFEKLEDAGIPVVFFDKVPDNRGFSAVCLADEEAGRLAAEALLKKTRHRVLAMFGKEDLTITRKRLKAFSSAFKKSGSTAELMIVHAATRDEARQLAAQALTGHPETDGLFCMSDEILAGAMKAVQERKIQVPEKLGVVCISNGFIPGLFNPEITYVETSGDLLGRASFIEMSKRLENNGAPREETIGARIIQGKSL